MLPGTMDEQSESGPPGAVIGGSAAGDWRRLLPPLAASISIAIFSIAAVSIPLAAGDEIGFTPDALGTWIAALFVIPGLLGLGLTRYFRIPLFFAWHTAILAFLASIAGDYSIAEMSGATLIGGLAVTVLGLSGLTGRVARLVPAPIVFAVVAGTTMPFVIRTFNELGEERVLVGAACLAWLVSRRVFGPRVPPILAALVVGIIAAALAGRIEALPEGTGLPAFEPAWPEFSFSAVVTVVPVFVALITLHANLTMTTYLRSQGYRPPSRAIEAATGLGSVVASFFGPVPVSAGSLVTPLIAGPEAGERSVRPWSVYFSSSAFVLIGIGGGVAAGLPKALPIAILLAVAGLALVGTLGEALSQIARGPLRLAPLLTFAVTMSSLSMWGLGSPFWGIAIGTVVAFVLERPALTELSAISSQQ
jgi:benzoate membrane transport protein